MDTKYNAHGNVEITDRRKNAMPEKKPPYIIMTIIIFFGLWMISKDIRGNSGPIHAGNDDNINLEKTYKKLEEVSDKINGVLMGDILYNTNYAAFTYNTESRLCTECHLRPNMYLLRTNLNMDKFKEYVRGDNRINDNTDMPKFDKNSVSDNTLEHMYIILQKTRLRK